MSAAPAIPMLGRRVRTFVWCAGVKIVSRQMIVVDLGRYGRRRTVVLRDAYGGTIQAYEHECELVREDVAQACQGTAVPLIEKEAEP